MGESALMVSRLDGTEERKLAVRKLPDYFYYPVWSPDGKRLVILRGAAVSNVVSIANFR